jgi:hypothetical protein
MAMALVAISSVISSSVRLTRKIVGKDEGVNKGRHIFISVFPACVGLNANDNDYHLHVKPLPVIWE